MRERPGVGVHQQQVLAGTARDALVERAAIAGIGVELDQGNLREALANELLRAVHRPGVYDDELMRVAERRQAVLEMNARVVRCDDDGDVSWHTQKYDLDSTTPLAPRTRVCALFAPAGRKTRW